MTPVSSNERMRFAHDTLDFGTNQDHREALEHYTKIAAEHGHVRGGANMMIERFVAIGETEEQAERNFGRLLATFGRVPLALHGGRAAYRPED
jgi:alkanesulfonate monooxygenase SsuD/methylene tetrahydromethanopterin reductase-like flavin-dependent oxidoreductase (luciferase family)